MATVAILGFATIPGHGKVGVPCDRILVSCQTMSHDRHLTVLNLGLVQRQAGVDPEIAELVVAYGRLMVDSGQPLSFDIPQFPIGSREHEHLSRLRIANQEVDARFLRFLAAWAAAMECRNRQPIFSRADLAQQLGMTPEQLRVVIGRRSSYYRKLTVPKRNGGVRIIHSPRAPLRPVQNWILRKILRGFTPSEASHGFTAGRSIVTNAAPHQQKRVVLNVDIEGFFPSIKFQTVRKGFQRLGYPYSVAVDLANLCTNKGTLPQGAPTSPALSNLACVRLDQRLTGLAKSLGQTYSRYADDLTFSSDHDHLPAILPFVREILADEGFIVAEHKTRVYRVSGRQLVNGLVVNESINIDRRQFRRLRAALHRLHTQGPDAVHFKSKKPTTQCSVKVLEGHLAFLKMINPARAKSLLAKWT
jgi:RNA-directed DNA polymerase